MTYLRHNDSSHLAIYVDESSWIITWIILRNMSRQGDDVAPLQIFLKEIRFYCLICNNSSAMPLARYFSPANFSTLCSTLNVSTFTTSVVRGTKDEGLEIAPENSTSLPYTKKIEDGVVKRNLLDDLCSYRRKGNNTSQI